MTEPNPLTSPRRNGSLTRLLLYIAAVMGTSLEILVLLICTPLSRFEHFTLHHFHWGTPDALQRLWINQSTHFQVSHLSKSSLPGQRFLRLHSVMPGHACPFNRHMGESLTDRAPCWSPPSSCQVTLKWSS